MKIRERNREVDIAKAILIISVVAGHYFTGSVHTYIFWFHMPAFIIISGLFVHDNKSLKDEIQNKFKRLLVPYFFFSIVLGTFGTDKSLVQQITDTIWGAANNITACTYPFYFITQLFLAFIIFNIILFTARKYNKGKIFVAGVAVCLYTFIQAIVKLHPSSIWDQIPWNADKALVSVCFLCVGWCTKDFIISYRSKYPAIVFVVVLIAMNALGYISYSYNLREHEWHWGLDIIIPYAFLLAILFVCRHLNKIHGLSYILQYVGKASLTILFLHPFFRKVNMHIPYYEVINLWIMTLFNVIECTLCYMLFKQYKYTKWIVGEK